MSIKSDVWIKRMCREQGLIEPFEEKLVRRVGDRKIISCGLSSYGYDCRLARDEFKVFSPVTGTEIDPKNFDASSLLDVPIRRAEDDSEYWLLPPHSYALGVTIERFQMPRNVTALAIGKSTYARCFRGDTRVALLDGTSPTLEEMARRAEQGELFWGYSIGDYGRIIATLLDAPRYIGRDRLMKIVLDNGEEIFCTPDHVFLRRDGREKEAHSLRAGDSLMPLYRHLRRGYEMVYQPINGHMLLTHRLADEWNIRNGIYEDIPDTHRHHIDGNRTNNMPWNLARMKSYTSGDSSIKGAARLLRSDRTVFRRFPHVIRAFKGGAQKNHKVVAVSELKGDHDVYCLTVPEAGNFALAAGVFVHNCGLIANTTPLEANWCGRLVVELYNAANLPVRLYAEEGFIQILFFESDEECETSYSDRGGKYQDQKGLTLAKV